MTTTAFDRLTAKAQRLERELRDARELITELRRRIAELRRPEMCGCGHTIRSHAPGVCVGCHDAVDPFGVLDQDGDDDA